MQQRVLLFRDSGMWVAHAVDVDLYAQGDTMMAAAVNMRMLLSLHERLDRRWKKEPFSTRQPADKWLRDAFEVGYPADVEVEGLEMREPVPFRMYTSESTDS